MRIQGLISGQGNSTRVGVSGFIAAIAALALLMPLILVAFLVVVVVGLVAAVGGLLIAGFDRIGRTLRSRASDGRKNVRVIPTREPTREPPRE